MNNKFAKILTILFQPLLMPLYGVVMLFAVPQFYGFNLVAKTLIIGITILLMVVVPVVWYFMLVKLKVITTPQASDRKERIWAYLFTALCYFGANRFLQAVESYMLAIITIMAMLLILTIFCINLYWKISAHAAGISGLLGASIYVGFYYNSFSPLLYVVLILIAGFVCSARLQLDAHTPMQLASGSLLGLLYMYPLPMLFF